jgi:hypothetical protein
MTGYVDRLRTVVEAGERLIIMADLFVGLDQVKIEPELREVLASELVLLKETVQKARTRLEGSVSQTQCETVTEFLLGTMQAIVSRLLSGESGQISVGLGIADVL